jgi:exopolysaccharide production protein ExoZ
MTAAPASVADTRAAPVAGLGRTIVSIQSLRFIAAFMVVLFHAHQAITRDAVGLPATGPLAYLFGIGAAGVHVFFCISGFVMIYTSYCHDAGPFSVRNFMMKRVLRIYPIYWLCCAAYLGFHYLDGHAYALSAREVLGALLLLPLDAPKIIGPAWTLFFEMYFYICFCLFMSLGLRPGLIAMTVFFFGSIVARGLYPALPVLPHFNNQLLLEFVGGAWVGYIAIRWPGLLARVAPAALVAGIAGFVASGLFGYDRMPSLIGWGLPSLAILIAFVGVEAARRLPNGVARLAFLGDGSYFLYLSHLLLIDMLLLTPIKALGASDTGAVILSIAIAAGCAALSVIAFNRVERPMLRVLRRGLLR